MGLSGLVSDGAKALVKLAEWRMSQSARYVPSPVCLVQLPVNRCNCKKQHQGLQEKLKTSPAAISEVSAQITVLQAQDKLEIDRQDYQQNLHALSQTIHLDLNTESQFGFELPTLQSILANVELGQTYAHDSRCSRCQTDTYQGHLVAVGTQISVPKPKTRIWVLTILLPWVYWHQQTEKTRHTELKQGYQPLNKHARGT